MQRRGVADHGGPAMRLERSLDKQIQRKNTGDKKYISGMSDVMLKRREAVQAHQDLEARKTTGSSIFVI
jgi:hypothetical protein